MWIGHGPEKGGAPISEAPGPACSTSAGNLSVRGGGGSLLGLQPPGGAAWEEGGPGRSLSLGFVSPGGW